MSIPQDQELQTYGKFDPDTLLGRIEMTRRAIRTIVDRDAPGFGVPETMKRSLLLLVRVANDKGLLKGKRV